MSDEPRITRHVVVIGLSVGSGGTLRDVVAELPFGATVESLAMGLAGEAGFQPDHVAIEVVRTGETLAPDAAAADCDLRSGDVIRLRGYTPPVEPVEVSLKTSRQPTEPLVTLQRADRRESGPARQLQSNSAGILELSWADGSVRIGVGDHVVGAGAYSDVQLPAPGLPTIAFELSVAESSVQMRSALDGGSVSVNGTVLNGSWHKIGCESRIRAGSAELHLRLDLPTPRPELRRLPPPGERSDRRAIELGSGGEVPFNRPPRRSSLWRPTRIELPRPPQPVRRVRVPFVAALVPLVAGLAMFLILNSAMMLAFMAISPLMAAGTYFSDRRSGRREHTDAAARFNAQLEAAGSALYEAVKTEVSERHAQAPQLAAIARWPADQDDRLWERRAFDADFLALPLGWGRLPALTQVAIVDPHGAEPDERVSHLATQYEQVDDVPYVVALTDLGAVGFAGDRPTSVDAARALVLQAALLHSPAELVIAAALPRGADSGWAWLKWLPHARTGAAVLGGPALGTGTNGVDVVQRIAELQTRRLGERETRAGRNSELGGPALLVVIDEELQLDRSLVADVLGAARTLRTPVIWVGGDPRGLPGHCRLTVDTAPDRTARVVEVETGVERAPIRLDVAAASLGAAIARTLSPIRDSSAASSAASIPGRIRLLDQLGLEAPSGEKLAGIWLKPRVGLSALIGAGAGAEMTIDLRADGPHALIAGTTGAGKSELLRTLVASLAARHPPSRLTFLLVDYKGGAAFAPCRALPHVLDVVSDLDAELGERALISLDAEMKRREHLLADLGADNLIDLERRAPEQAPPNLVIVVDEFAKLREEIPDFIDGVVDVAQRGRTLGIHMVLAAQSLRTAFTPAVRANTNLRIALRVTSETESQDVVDAPNAARIPSGESARGRAFARIGHERLIEFQTAHVSGRYLDPAAAQALVRPFEFGSVLAPSLRRGVGDAAPPGSDETDLAALARAAQDAARILGLPDPRPAWTPPLPHAFSREAIQQHTHVGAGRCVIGLVDEPAQQLQVPLTLELDRGHGAIFGVGGSGKTTALATIAASLAWDAPPRALHIYGLDAASGALGIITTLPHVGAVIPASDPERVERLLTRLDLEARARSQRFAAAGASTLTDYQHRVPADLVPPRILLLLDGFGEFASTYDDARPDSPFERLLSVLTAGRTAGIHVVLTAVRRGVVRANVAAHISQRLLLHQVNSEDLIAIGVPARLADRIELTPGRGFTGDGKLFQIARPVPSTADDSTAGFGDLGVHLAGVWPGESAPSIDALPDRFVLDDLLSEPATATRIPIAIAGSDLAPRAIDLSERHFIVSGPYRSGRSNALGVIAEQAVRANSLAEIHLLAPRRSPLADRGIWTSVARGTEGCGEAAATIAGRLSDLPEQHGPRVLVIIDDSGELQDAGVWASLERIVRLGRDRGVRVVAGAETTAARMLTNVWLRELRKDGQGLLLAPESLTDGDILGVPLPRRQTVLMRPGRGYLAFHGRATLVQLPLVESLRGPLSPEPSRDSRR